MEAEGDPTVIGMTLKVLRTKSGEMMGLKKLDSFITEDESGKVKVTLVSSTGEMSSYILTAGEAWPSSITPASYTSMPEKVTGGTYYAKA